MKDINKKPHKKNILGKNTFFYLLLGIFFIFLDQILKNYFTNHSYYFSFFSLHLVKNTGMSFGWFQGATIFMIIISFIFLVLLWFFRSEFIESKLGLVFLIAGTIGNLIDRVFRGYVIDFVDLQWFPVFNLSDTLITFGTICFIWIFIKDLKNERHKKKSK
ncbi:MAG: signal peptidase II [Candidatus Woesearchaeota archaeon]